MKMTKDLKRCTGCLKCKEAIKDFYMCSGNFRSECKACTIHRNVEYQRRVQAWKYRYGDEDLRKSYMREYYSKNSDKFAKYRSEFRERYPEYYKKYFNNRKKKQGNPKEASLSTR